MTRKQRDFLQNITIVVLSFTAVLLFAATQINSLGPVPLLSGGDLPDSSVSSGQDSAVLSAPVRVAVSGPFGRYGNLTLTTASEEFEILRGLLEQALGTARHYTACDARTFLDALGDTSVYYDFLSPLPLPVLSGLLQGAGTESLTARRVLVARDGTDVSLYLWSQGECLRSATSMPLPVLEETVNRYELGNAFFAFESQEVSARSVHPCSLFLETLPELPQLAVTVPLADTSLLLTRLGFNPNTQNRYLDSSGAEVVMESGRSLRIRSDGTVVYQSGGADMLTVPAEEEIPTCLEAASGVWFLLNDLLASSAGDASLYLESVRQVGGATVLEFGYQSGGIPIRFADGKSAAQVSLSNNTVTSMTLRLRQYTRESTPSLTLPLKQALAIAAMQEGAELSLGYTDSGDGTASAKWLAE